MADTLERSFLEGKERDELTAIANALGLKPSARAKKDTVIDQIIRAAGVEPEPARARPRKRADGAQPDAPVASSPQDEPAQAEGASGSAPEQGDGRVTADSAVTRRPPRAARTSSLFDPFAEAGSTESAEPDEDEWAFAAAKPAGAVTVETPAELREGREASEREPREPREQREPREPREGLSEGRRDGQVGDGSQSSRRSRRERMRDRRDGAGASQPGGQPGGPSGSSGSSGQSRPQVQGGAAPGNQNQGGFGSGFDNDASRRSRRRRGRDRDRQVTAGQDAVADRISESYTGELIDVEGLLDLADQGYGYVRAKGYLPSANDVYVPVNKVRQLGLRKGDLIRGKHRPATAQEKFPAIVSVETVNGHSVEVARLRPKFEDLTPLFPDVKLQLEQPGQQGNMVARIIDLVSPIGKGQRGLIVSPPKAGKTTIMKQIASSIEANNPEVHLMVLLIDERPEEVTDMRRHVKGEVVASTFDKPSDEHTMVAELAIDRAKRLVEEGRDVVIILDGITRLARAYNLAAGPGTGRIMSGGIDTGALYPPKKFFGAARNIEEGGSLTILATALIETGSTMDTVIFEEFKGTGNMEMRLDRRLAEKRIYPAINVNESSTRHEELLFSKPELEAVWRLRRVLNGLAEDGTAAKALELLMERIKTTRSNADFLLEVAKAPGVA